MLIKEIKEELSKYKEDDLKLIICELYKSIPKAKREEKDIDTIIRDLTSYKSNGKTDKKQKENINIDDLKPQIELFIDYAYNQYYFIPNQYVHKKERPKWRFMVKEYVKKLESIPISGKEGKIATDLFQKLYELLSYACAHWVFNTDNPFHSIGIMQPEMLNKVLVRLLAEGVEDKNIQNAIKITIDSNLDRETLHSQLIEELVCNLKTTDAREMAIKQCKSIQQELNEQKAVRKKSKSYSDSDYRYDRKTENITELVFCLYCQLCEYDDAIKYFHNNQTEENKEVSLYILLRLLYEHDLKNYWIREYEQAVSAGINPREGLQRLYTFIKEKNIFPNEENGSYYSTF